MTATAHAAASRELDGVVAKAIFGWKTEPVTYKDEVGERWIHEDGKSVELVWWPKQTPTRVGRYSEEIDAAMEVLDALGGEVQITRLKNEWTVQIGTTARWADTLPLAICLAALAAAGA